LSKEKILTIMIPTYNRAKVVAENLEGVIKILEDNHLLERVEIVISNNASEDDTFEVLKKIVAANKNVSISLFNQEQTLGSLGNMNFVLQQASCEYVMYLGDDDYISAEYLKSVLRYIVKIKGLSCIIPSYLNIDVQGNPTGRGRDIGKKTTLYRKGFYNSFANSWKGHQLSGLVFKRSLIKNVLDENNITNVYPFIFFVLTCTHQGKTVLLPEFPVLVTRPPQSEKSWSYGEDGLIIDVFENYEKYKGYNLLQRSILQLKFLDVQYWRYAMYIKRGIPTFIKCLTHIVSGKTTLLPTRIIFPFFLPIIVFTKIVSLSFKGELMNTLRTNVDI